MASYVKHVTFPDLAANLGVVNECCRRCNWSHAPLGLNCLHWSGSFRYLTYGRPTLLPDSAVP